jgi:hypothetical protein
MRMEPDSTTLSQPTPATAALASPTPSEQTNKPAPPDQTGPELTTPLTTANTADHPKSRQHPARPVAEGATVGVAAGPADPDLVTGTTSPNGIDCAGCATDQRTR